MLAIVDLDGRIQKPSVLARDRVREIDIRLRVKFSEISTGLDALHLFNVLTFCRAISISELGTFEWWI